MNAGSGYCFFSPRSTASVRHWGELGVEQESGGLVLPSAWSQQRVSCSSGFPDVDKEPSAGRRCRHRGLGRWPWQRNASFGDARCPGDEKNAWPTHLGRELGRDRGRSRYKPHLRGTGDVQKLPDSSGIHPPPKGRVKGGGRRVGTLHPRPWLYHGIAIVPLSAGHSF